MTRSRKPSVFVLSDDEKTAPKPVKATPKSTAKSAKKPVSNKSYRAPKALPKPEIDFQTEMPDPAALPQLAAKSRSDSLERSFRWGGILLSALFSLAVMWAGVTFWQLIENLFLRSVILGWFGTGLLVVAGIAALAIALREIIGIWRLKRLGRTQQDGAKALSGDEDAMKRTMADLQKIYKDRPDLRWGMAQLHDHNRQIMDSADRIHLAERDVIAPMDEEAGRIIARAARRVTLLTAITPAAILDILFVASQNLRMLRQLATLYGGRPHTLGTFRLARMVAGHLAITGGLALTDGIIQGIIGKGLLGRLSQRFGEGAINGILTARIGLAAIDLCRPLPFLSAQKPTLSSFTSEILNFSETDEDADKTKPGQP